MYGLLGALGLKISAIKAGARTEARAGAGGRTSIGDRVHRYRNRIDVRSKA